MIIPIFSNIFVMTFYTVLKIGIMLHSKEHNRTFINTLTQVCSFLTLSKKSKNDPI